MALKVVLDTNVIISAILWEGIPNEILLLTKKEEISLCACLDALNELEDVLKRTKFQKRIQELNTSVEDLISGIIRLVNVYSVITFRKIIKEDPADDMFINCALSSGAKIIISGDKHLIRLRKYENILVMTPQEFKDYFNIQKGENSFEKE